MTSLEDFHNLLRANPHDFQLMGLFADFVDPQGECAPITCKECRGKGHLLAGLVPTDTPLVLKPVNMDCSHCQGHGTLNAHLAPGFRAMSVVRPVFDTVNHCWWGWQSGFPGEWWIELANGKTGGVEMLQNHDTLDALTTAALAFARLSAEVQEKILTTGPWAEGSK